MVVIKKTKASMTKNSAAGIIQMAVRKRQFKKKNAAARTIQKVAKKRYPINAITLNPITNSWYVKWFKDPNHKHFSVYSLNTFNRINLHPETRAPKRSRNILLVRVPGKTRTSRPNIMTSPPASASSSYSSNSNNSTNNGRGLGIGRNGFVRFNNNQIVNGISSYHNVHELIQYQPDRLENMMTTWGVRRRDRARRNRIMTMLQRTPLRI